VHSVEVRASSITQSQLKLCGGQTYVRMNARWERATPELLAHRLAANLEDLEARLAALLAAVRSLQAELP